MKNISSYSNGSEKLEIYNYIYISSHRSGRKRLQINIFTYKNGRKFLEINILTYSNGNTGNKLLQKKRSKNKAYNITFYSIHIEEYCSRVANQLLLLHAYVHYGAVNTNNISISQECTLYYNEQYSLQYASRCHICTTLPKVHDLNF